MKHYNGSITTIIKRIEGQKFQNNYMDDFVCLDIETSNDHNEDVNELHTWLSSAQWLFRKALQAHQNTKRSSTSSMR